MELARRGDLAIHATENGISIERDQWPATSLTLDEFRWLQALAIDEILVLAAGSASRDRSESRMGWATRLLRESQSDDRAQ